MSLVARLYLLVLLAVLPAIVIQGYNELTLRHDREAQVHAEALRLAEFAASELNGLLEGGHTLLASLARSPSVRQRDAAACNRLVADLAQDIDKYVGLGAVDSSGRWFCAADPLPAMGAAASWVEAARAANGFRIGGYSQARAFGRGILPMTLPFSDWAGQPAGVVALGLDLDWLQRRFAARSMPPGAAFGIADRDGTLIVGVPNAGLVGQPMRQESRWMLAAREAGTLANVGRDDERRIVGYVPPAAMIDQALLVSVGLSPGEALAGVEAATRRGILLIVLGVALALLAARVAGRAFILQPVQALLQAGKRWRAGDFSARVGLTGRHAEFAHLGAAFDGMAASLEAHEREITRTLAALRASEERFRVAQEVSPDAFTILQAKRDAAGRIVDFDVLYANPKAAELVRVPAEQLIGRSLLEILPGHDGQGGLLARYVRVVETGAPDEAELFYDADGLTGWFHNLALKLEDGLVVRFSDITVRKRTEEALRESEERFRQFAENSHDLLWIYDRRRAALDYLSPAFEEIWGRSRDDLLSGRVEFASIIHPDDRDRVLSVLPEALSGKQVSVTYRLVRPDDSVRWVRDSGFPIRDGSGEIIRAGGICRDITQWKTAEEQRERALHERELMLREINHRVKNNLQVITSLLRLQAARSGSGELREAFEEACGRVSTIAELHMALFEGAQISTLDFGAYLHELCARLETATAAPSTADVRIEVEGESGPIDLDRAIPLGLTVNELVTAAVKHGFTGGAGGTVEVRFHRLDGRYRLGVRATGPGRATDGRAVLEPGLSLQLINGFVRRIEGSLSVEGEDGFAAVVDFPVEPTRQPRRDPAEPNATAAAALSRAMQA